MIDTVVLILYKGSYLILDPNKFTPSANVLNNPYSFGARAFIKCVQNTSKEDFKNGLSKVKLTLTKRATRDGLGETLAIEFSAPKLLYGNNLQELSDNSFDLLINTLRERLIGMGVETSIASLKLAKVSVVHFSKNIILPEYVTSSMILKELAKINITKRLELDKTFFKNDGHALTFYSKSYAIVLYDKLKDMQQTKGFKIDPDPIPFQQDLFSSKKTLPEIFRIEIRVNNYKKLESLLLRVGKLTDRSFVNIFSIEKAKLILQYHWSLLTNEINKFLFTPDENVSKTALEILRANPKINLTKLLSIIGYFQFVKLDSGRSLRGFIERHYSTRTWFRLNKVIKDSLRMRKSLKYLTYISDINKALEEFIILSLDIQKYNDK